MPSTTRNSAFRQGIVAGLPFLVVGGPFAALFGVIATQAGLDMAQALSMSFLVIAGAAQFTAIQLMNEAAPVWAVLAASLAVNLRMAMYSASLQPHLGAAPLWQRLVVAYLNVDASFALGIQEFEERPERPLGEKVAFFIGTMVLMAPLWVIGTLIGVLAGDSLPEGVSLDFAMPILFLGLVAPMLKRLAHLGAAVTSVVAALAFSGLPDGIGILFAAFLAMAAGAEIERRRG
ncbi:MAG: branched-chain amino acid ABC transporter permease [Silicimonas sp.]|nr:branched-chain amino acid ABC transporter permease [Silicimonas sp.]